MPVFTALILALGLFAAPAWAQSYSSDPLAAQVWVGHTTFMGVTPTEVWVSIGDTDQVRCPRGSLLNGPCNAEEGDRIRVDGYPTVANVVAAAAEHAGADGGMCGAPLGIEVDCRDVLTGQFPVICPPCRYDTSEDKRTMLDEVLVVVDAAMRCGS